MGRAQLLVRNSQGGRTFFLGMLGCPVYPYEYIHFWFLGQVIISQVTSQVSPTDIYCQPSGFGGRTGAAETKGLSPAVQEAPLAPGSQAAKPVAVNGVNAVLP